MVGAVGRGCCRARRLLACAVDEQRRESKQKKKSCSAPFCPPCPFVLRAPEEVIERDAQAKLPISNYGSRTCQRERSPVGGSRTGRVRLCLSPLLLLDDDDDVDSDDEEEDEAPMNNSRVYEHRPLGSHSSHATPGSGGLPPIPPPASLLLASSSSSSANQNNSNLGGGGGGGGGLGPHPSAARLNDLLEFVKAEFEQVSGESGLLRAQREEYEAMSELSVFGLGRGLEKLRGCRPKGDLLSRQGARDWGGEGACQFTLEYWRAQGTRRDSRCHSSSPLGSSGGGGRRGALRGDVAFPLAGARLSRSDR